MGVKAAKTTVTRARVSPRAVVNAKSKAKEEDAEALTGRPGQELGQVRGKPQPYTRGAANPGPTTRSQMQGQQEQGAKRGHEDKDESNLRKRSRFMRMARKRRKKGFDVTCPAEF